MKTINIIQKLSVIGIIILITVYLVNGQDKNQEELNKISTDVAYLDNKHSGTDDKTLASKTNQSIIEYNLFSETEKISEELADKVGLTFEINKTNTVSALEKEMEEPLIEDENNLIFDLELHFNLSKTETIKKIPGDFECYELNANEINLIPIENLIIFNVRNTSSVKGVQ